MLSACDFECMHGLVVSCIPLYGFGCPPPITTLLEGKNTSMTFPRPELSPMSDSTDLHTVLFWIANRAFKKDCCLEYS